MLDKKLRVLGAVDVVRDDRHRVPRAETLAEFETEHGLARTNRAADADARGTFERHEKKNLNHGLRG